MNELIPIPAKTLGGLALEDACECCFWLKIHHHLPWQIFPGIFNSIDAYSKKITRMHFERFGAVPSWLPVQGTPQKCPSSKRFRKEYKGAGVVVTGSMDDILLLTNGHYWIYDYKTSRFTANQDKLLPMYHTQLNGYAEVAESLDEFGPVDGMTLLYYEPETGATPSDIAGRLTDDGTGFVMPFTVHAVDVPRDRIAFDNLLQRAGRLVRGACPPFNPECPECLRFQELVAATS